MLVIFLNFSLQDVNIMILIYREDTALINFICGTRKTQIQLIFTDFYLWPSAGSVLSVFHISILIITSDRHHGDDPCPGIVRAEDGSFQ